MSTVQELEFSWLESAAAGLHCDRRSLMRAASKRMADGGSHACQSSGGPECTQGLPPSPAISLPSDNGVPYVAVSTNAQHNEKRYRPSLSTAIAFQGSSAFAAFGIVIVVAAILGVDLGRVSSRFGVTATLTLIAGSLALSTFVLAIATCKHSLRGRTAGISNSRHASHRSRIRRFGSQ